MWKGILIVYVNMRIVLRIYCFFFSTSYWCCIFKNAIFHLSELWFCDWILLCNFTKHVLCERPLTPVTQKSNKMLSLDWTDHPGGWGKSHFQCLRSHSLSLYWCKCYYMCKNMKIHCFCEQQIWCIYSKRYSSNQPFLTNQKQLSVLGACALKSGMQIGTDNDKL